MISQIIFWILLLDSLTANYITWLGNKEYWNRMKFFNRYMPLTKGWTTWYLLLVLFVGYILYIK